MLWRFPVIFKHDIDNDTGPDSDEKIDIPKIKDLPDVFDAKNLGPKT